MPSTLPARTPVPVVIQQHAEDAAVLRQTRSVLVRAPHVRLMHLRRLDDRLAAHLDGLGVAGPVGTQYCTQALERPLPGPVFAAAVLAIESRDQPAIGRLLALAAAVPAAARGLVAAFGWVPAPQLQGLVHPLLESPNPWHRAVGIAACRVQRVDPGAALAGALQAESLPLRLEALRAAGVLGRIDLLAAVHEGLQDPATAVEAACAASLLGGGEPALPVLRARALQAGPDPGDGTGWTALTRLLLSLDLDTATHLVRATAAAAGGDAAQERLVLRACALAGNTQLVPWLIERMADDRHARLAGEAFSFITGADLAALDLDRREAVASPAGPNDDPGDDNVALDEDESLPWPDRDAVQRWWAAHGPGLPAGARCFLGAAPSAAHCESALRRATQRQRSVAAHWLCTLQPGRVLFNIAAPSGRQQRLLDRAAS